MTNTGIKTKSAEQILDSLVEEQTLGDTKSEEKDVAQETVEQNQSTESSTDDIPNAQIRLDKMKNQRDKAQQEKAELEKKLANFEGKLSVLEKRDPDVEEFDPTEHMDETQAFLYNQNKELKEKLETLNQNMTEFKNNKLQETQIQEEKRFFEMNPELQGKKEELISDLKDYLSNKPQVSESLVNNEITIGEVYGMYTASKPRANKKSVVKNPDKVFSGHSNSIPSNKVDSSSKENIAKANRILADKHSTNKASAVDFLGNQMAEEILSSL